MDLDYVGESTRNLWITRVSYEVEPEWRQRCGRVHLIDRVKLGEGQVSPVSRIL
jgi:hypothetical protein